MNKSTKVNSKEMMIISILDFICHKNNLFLFYVINILRIEKFNEKQFGRYLKYFERFVSA